MIPLHNLFENLTNLFAIIVNIPIQGIDLYNAIVEFYNADIDDSHLPILSRKAQPRILGTETSRNIVLQEVYDFWQGRERRFYDSQWEILVPRFSTDKLSQDLDKQSILPFIEKDDDSKRGGFGDVYKVKIHEKHISDPGHMVRNINPLTPPYLTYSTG
jgi:hypothetical protein